MLSYLNSGSEEALGIEESETSDYSNLILHLTNKEPAPRLPFPFSFFYSEELPKGEEFLRFCKFGTMQVSVDTVFMYYFPCYLLGIIWRGPQLLFSRLWKVVLSLFQLCHWRYTTFSAVLHHTTPHDSPGHSARSVGSLQWSVLQCAFWLALHHSYRQHLYRIRLRSSLHLLHNTEERTRSIRTCREVPVYQICHFRSVLAERGDSCYGQSRRHPRYWYCYYCISPFSLFVMYAVNFTNNRIIYTRYPTLLTAIPCSSVQTDTHPTISLAACRTF